MIYNHYDVQPEDPVALWHSPPFELTERDGRWYGRGVADDKGEFVSRLAGWRLFREQHPGPLPFRLIWLVDGEEEIGSPSLEEFLKRRFPGERVDVCWWEYGEIDSSGRPIILCGFKGVMAVELRCRTAKADLHSSLGAVFDNPLWRLAAATASLARQVGARPDRRLLRCRPGADASGKRSGVAALRSRSTASFRRRAGSVFCKASTKRISIRR